MPRVRLAGALTFISLLVACGGSTTPPPKRAESMGSKSGCCSTSSARNAGSATATCSSRAWKSSAARSWSRSADGDPAKQLADANALLDEGVKVLVVVPTDLEKAGAIVQAAAAKKVPVVSYDRLIRDADVALYVSFDNVKVGRMQAERLVARAPKGNYVLLGGFAHRLQRAPGPRWPDGRAQAARRERRDSHRRRAVDRGMGPG
jgi:ABC-type sugar transport system substrate-binding protein